MRTVLLLLIISMFAGAGFGQVADKQRKDSLMKMISRQACQEITAAKSEITADNLEMSLGLIMMRLMAENATELQEAFQLDLADQESMTSFSQQLGMNLIVECPEFMKIVAGKTAASPVKKDEQKTGTLSGTFEKLAGGDFTYFLLRSSNGKIEKIYWLEYFDGANLLDGKLKSNARITVRFYEKEIYNSRIKEYVTIKVAAGISED